MMRAINLNNLRYDQDLTARLKDPILTYNKRKKIH